MDYNLEAAESDDLLVELLEATDDADVDLVNMSARTKNRHPSLYGLYPLPDRRDARENRTPAPPPSEAQGLRLHIKVSELRCSSPIPFHIPYHVNIFTMLNHLPYDNLYHVLSLTICHPLQ